MLGKLEGVRVLQKTRKEYEGNAKFYILLGDGQSDVLKFRIDDEQLFAALQPFDVVNATIDLYSYNGNMYASIKNLELM